MDNSREETKVMVTFGDGFTELYEEYNSSESGRELLKLSGISQNHLDTAKMIETYFAEGVGAVTVDANANVGNSKCPNNLAAEMTKGQSKFAAYHIMWTKLADQYGVDTANELIRSIWDGKIYFHDMTGAGITAPYCFAASTLNLMFEGRPYGQLQSKPPKRTDSFVAQAIEYTMDLSQDFMGAIALGDFIVNYAVLLHRECDGNLTDEIKKRVENDFQKFVHVVNHKYRTGSQSPFVNISIFDRPQIEGLFKNYKYPFEASVTDIIEYVMEVQGVFMEFMAKKDPISGLPYRFPVCTLNITTSGDEVIDTSFLEQVCRVNTEGVFNVFVTEGVGKVASCCRLLNNLNEFEGRVDVWGNGGLNIGSTRVCTLNLARVAMDAKMTLDQDEMNTFLSILRERVQDTVRLLYTHRMFLKEVIGSGYLKFFKPLGWIDLDSMLFSTVGVLGLYEAVEILAPDTLIPSDEGVTLAEQILLFIDEEVKRLGKDSGVPYNVEQIPAEQAAITMASQDKVFYGASPYLMYANQSLPLWIDADIVTRGVVDGRLNKCYSGGGISHLNIGSEITPTQVKAVIQFAIRTGMDHFALNPIFSKCENGCVTLGSGDTCPECTGSIVERETRIVGYFVPISDWSSLRKNWDFPQRKWNGIEV